MKLHPDYGASHPCKITTLKFSYLYPSLYLKGKAIPLEAWTGLEGSRRLRLPDF